ncbi:thiamine phosphate synthase [Sphingobacterium gobiense]|uniref:Thiamine phosphate synthase n=1 Tax=Sphingobacterium gobiense TaxID=1382456 RepID=A0A2S9JS61_9SPHI|nr:thiamine phosphate synthase [Sphingobacterium gobiense]PRD56126.1 thiamine phosphate synthase [Sphingobacterium gobiense]
MIILLSPEQPVAYEVAVINALLERGLPLFHIRKYQFSDTEMMAYVNNIDSGYRQRLVLHSHFHLANELGIERLHFREEDREQNRHKAFMTGFTLSTSVHTIAAFNSLMAVWDYAFLSPIFPSISKKGYGVGYTVLDDLSLRRNLQVRLVGLGGIDQRNYSQVMSAGADGVALLGAIWKTPAPIQVFETINKHIPNGISSS